MNTERSFVQPAAPGVQLVYEADRVLHHVKSSEHEKLVIENAHFGRMMMIDGATCSALRRPPSYIPLAGPP